MLSVTLGTTTVSVAPATPVAAAKTTATVAAPLPLPLPLPSAVPPGPKALSARQIEEVRFWTPQLKEHALFLYLLLEPVPAVVEHPLIGNAGTTVPSMFTTAPESLQKMTAGQAPLVHKLKERSMLIFNAFAAFEKQLVKTGKVEMPALSNLINHLRYVKSRVMDLQGQNIYVGAIFPDFVEHIRDELDYFVRRFNDTIAPDEERLFWTHVNADHAAFAAHLLNTEYSQRPLVRQGLALSDEGHAELAKLKTDPVDLLQMAELSRRFNHLDFANRVNGFSNDAWNNGNPKVSSIIHPVLLAHVIREGQRSVFRLKELGFNPPPTTVTLFAQLAGVATKK